MGSQCCCAWLSMAQHGSISQATNGHLHFITASIFCQVERLRWPWEFGRPVGSVQNEGISPSAQPLRSLRKRLSRVEKLWRCRQETETCMFLLQVSRCFTMFHDVSRCVLLSRQSFQKHSGVMWCLLIPYHSHRLQPLNWNCHHRLDSDAKWVVKDFCIPNVGDLKTHGHQVTPHFVLLSKDFYMKAGTRWCEHGQHGMQGSPFGTQWKIRLHLLNTVHQCAILDADVPMERQTTRSSFVGQAAQQKRQPQHTSSIFDHWIGTDEPFSILFPCFPRCQNWPKNK